MSQAEHVFENAEAGVATEIRRETKRPMMYKVLLHNDDYTSQEFVVLVLETIFHKSEMEATQIMLAVHHHGVSVVGVYPYEIAETKVGKVLSLARQYDYPLQCTLEQE